MNDEEPTIEWVDEVPEESTSKSWPSPQDYNEALQYPQYSLLDPELRSGSPELDQLGLPRPDTGGFASVYRFHCGDTDWAIRCFLHSVTDQQARYQMISDELAESLIDYMVSFDYQAEGIQIGNTRYPIIKMEWVNGSTLEKYIEGHLNEQDKIADLCERFLEMTQVLQKFAIAHGDLQHGNILVTAAGDLRLVDYDGMFVPMMVGRASSESGHPNYQHPKRTSVNFSSSLDNFSQWVIYTSLRAIAIDPSLYKRLNGGNDCLLFRRADFTSPSRSNAFHLLESHSNSELGYLARFLRWQLQRTLKDIPPLTISSQEVPNLEPVQAENLLPVPRADRKTLYEAAQLRVPESIELRENESVAAVETFRGTMGATMLKAMFSLACLVLLGVLMFHRPLLRLWFIETLAAGIAAGFLSGTVSRFTKTLVLTDQRIIEFTDCKLLLWRIDYHTELIEFKLDEIQSVTLQKDSLKRNRLSVSLKPGCRFVTQMPSWATPSNGSLLSLIGLRKGQTGSQYLVPAFKNSKRFLSAVEQELLIQQRADEMS